MTSEATRSPEQGPPATLGQLMDKVIAVAMAIERSGLNTNTHHTFVRQKPRFLGTGMEEYDSHVFLSGWDQFISRSVRWGGGCTLHHDHTARWLLGTEKYSSDTYRLSYEYATDSEGRSGETLFNVYVNPELPSDSPEARVPTGIKDKTIGIGTLLQAHLDAMVSYQATGKYPYGSLSRLADGELEAADGEELN